MICLQINSVIICLGGEKVHHIFGFSLIHMEEVDEVNVCLWETNSNTLVDIYYEI